MAAVTTRVCSFCWDDEARVVRATMREGATFELADAEEAVDATFRVAGERRTRVLVDMRGVRSQSRAAREHFSSAETARHLSAVALLVASPLSRMIANFFLRTGSIRVPTRLFDDETSALAWLHRHPE